MHQFALVNEFASNEVEYESFSVCIAALDSAFLTYQREESKRSSEASKREAKMNAAQAARRVG